ncbi:hypothetical protein DXG01_005813 [Tephrocybe rancida]|nr:hypothetical protein DXG01_005813 [Tephrocybe rancida]
MTPTDASHRVPEDFILFDHTNPHAKTALKMPDNKTPTTPIQPLPSAYPSTSKLPKFLRVPASRDRSKSVAETSTTSLASTSDGSTAKARKSRLLSQRSTDAPSLAPTPGEQDPEHEEAPVIVEPVAILRPHRSTGSGASLPTLLVSPTSSPPPEWAQHHLSSLYASTPSPSSSSSRISDLPTRLRVILRVIGGVLGLGYY